MSARRQLIIAAVAGVLVTVLFFFFVLTPKLDQISEIREQVESAQDNERTLAGQLKRLEDARQRTARTRARLAVADKFLPSSADLPGFIRLVQTAATASGIDLRSLAPSAPQGVDNAEGVETIAVTLTIQGGFRRLEDFLSRLENLERVVEVRSLSVSPAQDTLGDQFTLSTSVNLQMYVVQDEARVGGGGTTVARPTPTPTPRPS